MGAKLQCCSPVADNQNFQKDCLAKASKEYLPFLNKTLEEKLFYMIDTIVGDWGQRSVKNGKGIIFSNETFYYQGDIVHSKAQGFGRIYWPNRAMYIGRMVNNQADGQGQLIFDQGAFTLKGYWKNGEPVKNAKMLMKTRQQTSQVTVLQMKSSKDHHQNVGKESVRIKIEFGQGVVYEGEVKQKKDCVFKFEGEGKLIFADGSSYNGSFLNGKMEGKGKYYWASNQHWYEGEYKNNLRDGQGTYYFNELIYKKGLWRGGSLISQQK